MNYDEFMQGLEAMDPRDLETAAAVLGIMFIAVMVFAVIWYVLTALGYLKMFKKAGEAGWKGFVPFLNQYTLYKLTWKPMFFWIFIVAAVIMQLLGSPESTALTIVSLIVSIVVIVISVKYRINIAKAYGKGVGTGILMIFFPFIVCLVLGFGKSQYVGNPSVAAPAEENTYKEA